MVSVERARAAAAPRRAAKAKGARLWWRVHQWAGLKLSIILGFVFLTGTIAVFSNEIDWMLRPAMRVDPATVEGPVAWSAAARNVAALHPQARILLIEAPIDRGFATIATIQKPDGRRGFVYLHPSTGAVRGEGPWVGAQRILRNMHRHLNLPTKIGVPIVSALSILLLISVATSFVVYKKWWRGLFRPIRWRDARTAMGDLHRLAGLWSLWFVALIGATGLWYLAESTVAKAPPAPRAKAAAVKLDTRELADRLEANLTAARAAYPGLRIQRIVFPAGKVGAFQFQGQHRAVLVRERANVAWTNAATGAVVLLTDGRELTAHQRLSEMADPLHFGTFGGVWTKLIWFVFGLVLTGVAVSGVAVYALRLSREGRASAVWATAWRGMGPWRWPALVGVGIALALLPTLFRAAGGD
ncbi:putative iron-regulated membrane protein [Caulobacter sp. AP07]|uniref:PepSY-associated TM helix domain-containing protein n=1 Tax=Caulobacter sp. AP07 TaxID=1144304 RepID=UPI000271EDE4|nr:PepSY-associated TM helix domain-containing protein [Caulobacter sp. AP07]EJL30812.1 putative iron-regulated membrane protein [Caulobacter sp. AP07]